MDTRNTEQDGFIGDGRADGMPPEGYGGGAEAEIDGAEGAEGTEGAGGTETGRKSGQADRTQGAGTEGEREETEETAPVRRSTSASGG